MPTLISENGQSATTVSGIELRKLIEEERVIKLGGIYDYYKLVTKEQKKIIEEKRKEAEQKKLFEHHLHEHLKNLKQKRSQNLAGKVEIIQRNDYFEHVDQSVLKKANKTMIFDVWCDGSIHPYTKKASIGGIIKTLNGDVLYHYAKEVPYHRDILYIEYLALHTMLTKITKLNIKNINVHMDNLNLIDWIEGKPSKYGRLSRARKDVREIHESTLEKLNKLRYFIMTWIPREENKEADRLAKKIYIRG